MIRIKSDINPMKDILECFSREYSKFDEESFIGVNDALVLGGIVMESTNEIFAAIDILVELGMLTIKDGLIKKNV